MLVPFEKHKNSYHFAKTGKFEAPLCHTFILYKMMNAFYSNEILKSLIHFKCFSFHFRNSDGTLE